MEKFKKWTFRILKVLGVLVALYFVVALFAPGDYRVERNKEMTASPEVIYQQIFKFENWDAWSPWVEKDPTLVSTRTGESGTVGAKTSWEGDPELSGKGSMIMTELVENEKIAYDLHFESMDMHSVGAIELESGEEIVTVKWYDQGDIPFLFRPMMLFMDLDEMMGTDFERGLVKLDSIATIRQVEADSYLTYAISEIDFPETKYYGIRKNLSFSEVDSSLYGSVYGQLGMFCETNQIEITGAPVSINFEWDEFTKTADIMPAFQVGSVNVIGSEGITSFMIPAARALVLDYYGEYEEVGPAYEQLATYLTEKGLSCTLALEEYVGDPGKEESMDDVLTRIYFILD